MSTYYLNNTSPNASNLNSGTSAADPFNSLAALDQLTLKPGDIVEIAAGTSYNGTLTIQSSGTAAAPVLFTKYGSGADPVISTTGENAISMEGANYVIVDHIDVGGAIRAGVMMDANSNHDTLQNMDITNVAYGYDLQGSQYDLITGNYIHNLNMYVSTGDYQSGAEAVTLEAANNNNISNNLIVDAEALSSEYGTDGGGFEFWNSCSGNNIYNNVVLESDGFVETGGQAGSVISNNQIYNNVSANNGGFFWIHNVPDTTFGTVVNGLSFTNNTIYEPTAWYIGGFDGPAAMGTLSFTKNLVYAPDSGQVFSQTGSFNANNFYQVWIPPTGTGETAGTINFVNPSANEYQVASGTAAADGAYAGGNMPGLPSAVDTIGINVSQDQSLGYAQFILNVDGQQVGGTYTINALHSTGASQNFLLTGDWGAGQHEVTIAFTNASNGGSLYVNSISENGTTYSGTSSIISANSSQEFSVGGSIPITTATPPTVVNDWAATEENRPVTIAVLANDSDSLGTINPASVAVTSAAAHGTTAVNATTGAITYTPATGYSGTDTFRYTVANTVGGLSAPATVTLTVDTPPTAAADSATTSQNRPVTIAVLANDSDSLGTINPASVAVISAAAHGTTAVNATTGAITYTPATGYSGTDTFQYTVANTVGGLSAPASVTVVASGSGYADGAAAAAAGTPQAPGILAGYAVRPSWRVAGVDYAVGVPAGTTLQDPTTISIPGVSVNATSHVVAITGNNVTLKGYDFSLNGGWQARVTGQNDTIEFSNFAVGAKGLIPITASSSATNLAVLYNTIDGGGAANPSAITALLSDTGTGLTVEYNWLKNAPQTVIAVKGGTLIDEFDLVQNVGFGPASAESDLTFSGGVSNNSVISFNTFYNPPHPSEPKSLASGLQIEAQNIATLTNVEVENNTIISPGPTRTNSYLVAIHQDAGSNIVNGVNVEGNYLDATGASAAYFPTTKASNVAFVNNINLKTGSVVPGIAGTVSSNVSEIAVTSGSGTVTAGVTVIIAVSLNEVMTVKGVPTLSLNDGGIATYAGGSGTTTLTFATTISTSNRSVSALAVTGVNLPSGAIIVDAAGDAANLSGITQAISGAPAVAPAGTQTASVTVITASAARINPAASHGTSLVTPTDKSGPLVSADLGVSSPALAFLASPTGATEQTAPTNMTNWLGVGTPGYRHRRCE